MKERKLPIPEDQRLLEVGFSDQGFVIAINLALIAHLQKAYSPERYASLVKATIISLRGFIDELNRGARPAKDKEVVQ